jgi:glucose/arabinose dehydrogenase
MNLPTVAATREAVLEVPVPARPRLDPAHVVVPDGYRVEVLVAGLSMPCGMGVTDDGDVYLLEGGSTWPTRPHLPARILRLRPDGVLESLGDEPLAGPRHIAFADGAAFVSEKGGHTSRIVRIELDTLERTVVVDGLPDGGWHEPGGPIVGPDGLLYFGQGSVSQNGVLLPQGYTVDLARHPRTHDVPGQDVTLTGTNVVTYDPTKPYPYYAHTGAFKPFGVPARPGEVVRGELKCSSGIWRSQLDGSGMELLAWGVRNPYGMAFGEDGELYVSDNDFEETGDRAVANDPDRVWRIDTARRPYGSVTTPAWYGFPDICGDGLPVWDESHLPSQGQPARQLIADPPPWAGPAAYLERPHSCLTGMDACRSDSFGRRGSLFVAEWGTLAPLNSPRPEDLDHGFAVVAIDPATGTGETFLRNRRPGPASASGDAGIERPVDVKFGPDGAVYLLDFGVSGVDETRMVSYGHTGALWRVVRG